MGSWYSESKLMMRWQAKGLEISWRLREPRDGRVGSSQRRGGREARPDGESPKGRARWHRCHRRTGGAQVLPDSSAESVATWTFLVWAPSSWNFVQVNSPRSSRREGWMDGWMSFQLIIHSPLRGPVFASIRSGFYPLELIL